MEDEAEEMAILILVVDVEIFINVIVLIIILIDRMMIIELEEIINRKCRVFSILINSNHDHLIDMDECRTREEVDMIHWVMIVIDIRNLRQEMDHLRY